jgi:CheY-like chemotaxis protein
MSRVHKAAPRILVVDADPVLLGLLEEWLGGQRWRVVADLAKEILALRNGGRP